MYSSIKFPTPVESYLNNPLLCQFYSHFILDNLYLKSLVYNSSSENTLKLVFYHFSVERFKFI